MSSAENKALSILLPDADVTIFTRDTDTASSVKAVLEDWRFARVKISVEQGGINEATQFYKDYASPDLIIVQTENIDDSLPGRLEALAGHCEEGTAAIVIGPVNDVYLYRKLVEMGVSDYLVKPVTPDVLSDVIAKTLVEKIGIDGSRLIAFIGAKGGVGTSALAQAAAWLSADHLGQKTFMLDLAGGWSANGVGMGYEPSTTLKEAAKAAQNNDEDSLNRMLASLGGNLSVLASGGDVMLEPCMAADQLEELLNMVMQKYPVVIADLSQSAPDLQKTIISRAQHIFVVSTMVLPSLRMARSLISEVKDEHDGNAGNIDLILNMEGVHKAREVGAKEAQAALEHSVSAHIPFKPELFFKTESEGQKLISDKDGYVLAQDHILPLLRKALALGEDNIAGGKAPQKTKTGLLGGLMKPLTKKH